MLRLETSTLSDSEGAAAIRGVFPGRPPRSGAVAVELQDRAGRVIGGVWLDGNEVDETALALVYELLDARDTGPVLTLEK